jgi:hypothetical protein
MDPEVRHPGQQAMTHVRKLCEDATDGIGLMTDMPQACTIEIIERTTPDAMDYHENGAGILKPNEMRINGTPVYVSADHPLIVHEIDLRDRDEVKVTLTLFARLVHIGAESTEK